MPTINKGVETKFEPNFGGQLNSLVAEVEARGGHVVYESGYRSPEKQADMLKHPAKYGVAPGTPIAAAGTSDHGKGTAADLSGDAMTMSLLHELAPKYGIRNNIPNDKNHFYVPGDKNATTGTYSPGVDNAAPEPLPLIDRLNVLASLISPESQKPDTAADLSTAQGINVKAKTAPQGPSGQVAPPAMAGTQGGGNEANRALGQQLAAKYGWDSGPEWEAFNNVVMGESGWNATAANPSSSARGIAQNINGYGPGYEEGNAEQQINWMLDYVKKRYGTPAKAWEHKLATKSKENPGGWY